MLRRCSCNRPRSRGSVAGTTPAMPEGAAQGSAARGRSRHGEGPRQVLEPVPRRPRARRGAPRDLPRHGPGARRLGRELPPGRVGDEPRRPRPRELDPGDGGDDGGPPPAQRLARLRGARHGRRRRARRVDLGPARARGAQGADVRVRHAHRARGGGRNRDGVRREALARLHLRSGALRWRGPVGGLVGLHAVGLRRRLCGRVLREETVAMTFPLSYLADFDSLAGNPRAVGLAMAVLLGIAFGFVLERGGFGRAQKLVGQFYGHDMTVLKVMFTAIASAMLGVVVLAGVGVLDLQAVQFNYPTFLWPMIVGGLLLGAGFVVSGYCPGTSFVATASGKLDGLATVLGVIAGTVVYAELEPRLGGFQNSGKLGVFTLSKWLHLPPAVIAVLVAVLAVGAFVGAERIERRLARGPAGSTTTSPATSPSTHSAAA